MKTGIRRFGSQDALSEMAALKFAAVASEAVRDRNRFCVALSGGGTPQGMYARLGEPPYKTQISWQRAHLFWGDERLVPPDDPGSNFGQAAQTLLNNVAIPKDNIHRAKGELTAAAAVSDYKAQLHHVAGQGRAWPRFDLVLLGLGSDGHTASLFPGKIRDEEKDEPVMAVTAEYDDRPSNRITLTPLLINEARHIIFLVTGANKAEALAAVLSGPYQPERWPAQRIRPIDGKVTWLVDEAAASQLSDSMLE